MRQMRNFRIASKLLSLFVLTFILVTCQKDDLKNPWDEKAKLPKDAWAPKNLAIADISITEKKLNWT
jgi:hypothetical protein